MSTSLVNNPDLFLPSLEDLSALVKPERRITVHEMYNRFIAMVDVCEGGCWTWIGRTNRKGYGEFHFLNGATVLAHRLSWFMRYGAELLKRGQNADGMCMLHRCDNPPCVNPEHLFLGTKADNNADMKAKGRARCGSGRLNVGERNGQVKLSAANVVEIRILCGAGDMSHREIGDMFGVCRATISAINCGKIWRIK